MLLIKNSSRHVARKLVAKEVKNEAVMQSTIW